MFSVVPNGMWPNHPLNLNGSPPGLPPRIAVAPAQSGDITQVWPSAGG